MIRTERDNFHHKLDQTLNELHRNDPGFSVAWRATHISGSDYAHSSDVWAKLKRKTTLLRGSLLTTFSHGFEEPEQPERR